MAAVMTPDDADRLRALMTKHQLSPVVSDDISCIAFERIGLKVETCNGGETYKIDHGSVLHVCTSFKDLRTYLEGLPTAE